MEMADDEANHWSNRSFSCRISPGAFGCLLYLPIIVTTIENARFYARFITSIVHCGEYVILNFSEKRFTSGASFFHLCTRAKVSNPNSHQELPKSNLCVRPWLSSVVQWLRLFRRSRRVVKPRVTALVNVRTCALGLAFLIRRR